MKKFITIITFILVSVASFAQSRYVEPIEKAESLAIEDFNKRYGETSMSDLSTKKGQKYFAEFMERYIPIYEEKIKNREIIFIGDAMLTFKGLARTTKEGVIYDSDYTIKNAPIEVLSVLKEHSKEIEDKYGLTIDYFWRDAIKIVDNNLRAIELKAKKENDAKIAAEKEVIINSILNSIL